MNSRTKGAIGEREVASMLREYGYKEDIQAFCISVVNAGQKKVFSQKQD